MLWDEIVHLTGNTQLLDFNAGLNWDTEYGSLNINLSHSKDTATQVTDGYLVTDNLKNAIANGSYNPFDIYSASKETLEDIYHTEYRQAESISQAIIIDWSSTLQYELGGGQIGYAIGAEYRENDVDDHKDSQSAAGNIRGPFGNEVAGEVNYRALYAEIELPITEELAVTAASRYDSYSLPDADNVSNALAIRYQAMEDLVLRASYSEGFRVAAVNQVTGTNSVGYYDVVDPKYCDPIPFAERPTNEFCESNNAALKTSINPKSRT